MAKSAELSMELIIKYKSGDTDALNKLCLANRNFITACAGETCRKFRCEHMRDDLISVGMVSFLEQLSHFDPSSDAALTTYLYPHIMGAMRREAEKNLGCMSLSKRDFHLIRKADALHKLGYSVSEIANELGVSAVRVHKLLSGSLYYSSLDEMMESDEDGAAVQIPAPILSVHREVYFKICVELAEEEFGRMSFKERELIGGFYGMFDHEEQTLAELGEQFNMKENAAAKAKDKAVKKLAESCLSGKLGVWQEIYHAVMKLAMEG